MRLPIREVLNRYNTPDAGGVPMGMRAFRDLTKEVAYNTTKNLIKYVNKQVRNMIDKGYKSAAVLNYATKTGRYDANEAKRIRIEEGREAEMAYIRKNATIYVSKKDSLDVLKNKLLAGIKFRNSKTSTIYGERRAQKQTNATLKEKYGLDFKDWTQDEIANFWDYLHEITDEGGRFAAEWNLGSATVLNGIVHISNLNGTSYNEAMRTLADQYDDLSEEGLRNNPSEAFQTNFPTDDFDEFQELINSEQR